MTTSPVQDQKSTAQVQPDQIMQIAAGFLAAKLLFIANEIALFEKLADGPATGDALAERIGVPRRTLRIVADAMAALGLLQREKDRYENSSTAATFLSGCTPADLRPFLRFWNRLSYPRWMQLEEAVRTDQARIEFTEEQQQLYSHGVEAVTAGTAQILPLRYDFSRHHRLLDVGGGTGSFLLPLLERNPSLQCTLFDVAPVAAIARQRLTGKALTKRIRMVEGNFFKDPIPDGHDAVIVANILHCFPPEPCIALLRRIRSVVPQRARLLLVDFWTDTTHTQPLFAALMAGEFLLTPGGGDVYSVEEGAAWLRQTGWRLVEHTPLVGPASLVVAETASGE